MDSATDLKFTLASVLSDPVLVKNGLFLDSEDTSGLLEEFTYRLYIKVVYDK